VRWHVEQIDQGSLERRYSHHAAHMPLVTNASTRIGKLAQGGWELNGDELSLAKAKRAGPVD